MTIQKPVDILKHKLLILSITALSVVLLPSNGFSESVSLPVPLGSYWAGSGTNLAQESYVDIPLIERTELMKLLREKKVLFLDIREPSEYAKSHIPNALNISFVNRGALFNQLKINPDQTIVTYCNWDFRGYVGAVDLKKRGVPNVVLMYPHGLRGWMASGFPVAGTEAGKTDEKASDELNELLKDEKALGRLNELAKPSRDQPASAVSGKTHRVTLRLLAKKVDPAHIEASVGDKLMLDLSAEEEDHWFIISDFGVNLRMKKGEHKTIELNLTRPGYFPMGCILCCVKYQCRLKQAILVDVKESLASYGE